MSEAKPLSAVHVLEYDYTRSLGPTLAAFFDGLSNRKLVGARTASGKVVVPPTPHDPETGEDIAGLVDLPDTGVVTTWAWVSSPRPKHPLQHPFAWALVLIDGADTAMLHVVDAGDASRMSTGMRVKARWAEEPKGSILDLACFEPDGAGGSRGAGAATPERSEGVRGRSVPDQLGARGSAQESDGMIVTPTRLEYDYSPGEAATRFLRHVEKGRYVGQRCPKCKKVYVPPRGSCPTCGVATEEEVELANTGTISTFCVVNIPFAGQAVECPYVSATIKLDGADIGFYHLIQEVPYDQVHIGMRVEAVWKERSEWRPTTESIKYFRPIEEDA